jgi:hypothetical protein
MNSAPLRYLRNCSGALRPGSANSRHSAAEKHKFRFKNKLLPLDSTTVSLCLTMFPWAEFRRAKGGVKTHVLLDHDDYLPAYVLLTEAKRSDVKLADSFRLNPGSIVAIDRGYIDYAFFARWSMAGVFFVTRLKDNAAFEVVEECQPPRTATFAPINSSALPAPEPKPATPNCGGPLWSGTPTMSARSSCSRICWSSALPPLPPSTKSAGKVSCSSKLSSKI